MEGTTLRTQYVNRRNAFGLDTDRKRLVRLFFQPALVYWALKSTQGDGGKRAHRFVKTS